MTEADWLTATDPRPMLEFLRGRASDRKLRLFTLACLPVIARHITDVRSQAAIEVLADFVEGRASSQKLDAASGEAAAAMQEILADGNEQRWHYVQVFAADAVLTASNLNAVDYVDTAVARCVHVLLSAASVSEEDMVRKEEYLRQSRLLRDIFHPVAFDPAWRSETVAALATGIYADRAFDRLPILADALEEAGCDQPDILTHCRGPGPHVRGCWAVDLVLGKS